MIVTVETAGPEATEALAACLAGRLAGGELIRLEGELGAGKTCFVRGLARGLDIDVRAVKSPSYNILHCYGGGRVELDHFDAYFIREAEEFERTGLSDFLAAGHVVAVEWADRFAGELDRPGAVRIHLEHVDEERRRIVLDGGGALLAALPGAGAERPDVDTERTGS